MNGFVGYFLHSDEGRRFIIQVPGVSKSSLSDAELSDLMNWVVREYSAEQMPDNFVPYTAAEIGRLRRNPEADPLQRRGEVLLAIAENVPALRCYSDAWVTLGGCE
jgi:hypothetical protein